MTAYTGKYRMWQFSSAGIINGIDGYVDLDVEYFVSENNMRPPEEEAKVKAMYRLYNPYVSDHHYTLSSVERDGLVQVGWIYEGIGWYSDRKRCWV